MIAGHLPILQVALPLIAAPLCVLLRRSALAWAFATLVSWLLFAISILLLIRVMTEGVVSYHLGGWAPPFGIEYRLDALNCFVLLVISAIAAVVTPYMRQSVAREITAPRHNLFYGGYLLALTGLLGIAATGDAFNIFVFMEISSLASYVLIGLGSSRRARAAADDGAGVRPHQGDRAAHGTLHVEPLDGLEVGREDLQVEGGIVQRL